MVEPLQKTFRIFPLYLRHRISLKAERFNRTLGNSPESVPSIMVSFRIFLAAAIVIGYTFASAQSEPVRDKNVEAQLISTQSTIVPGEPFTIGLRLKIDPTWHTYWVNPGPTGKPTTLDLDLPPGWMAGELQFPVPKKFITDYSTPGFEYKEPGFGYEGEVVHPMEITPPDDLESGTSVTLSGNSAWLMCDPNTCVPGKAALSITLQVGESAQPSPMAGAIEKAISKVPVQQDWPVRIAMEGETLVVSTDAPGETIPENSKLNFYPLEVGVVDLLPDPEIVRDGETYELTFATIENATAAPESFSGLLVAETDGEKTGYLVSTETEPIPVSNGEESPVVKPPAQESPEELPFGGGLVGILFAAFLGGMILNVMPCVFPVISLKVMSFVGQAGEDRKKVLAHSSVFALGILIFFWVLTIMMLVLRSASEGDVGWGAQLQQPFFVVVLIFVMVAVALSLFGTIEFGTSMTAMGGELTNKSGYAGSFWSGALAVLLATPCTAPFMAPAIGFALSQSAVTMFMVFTAMGLGLAAPYFVFAAFPKLLDVIPAPGPWMETFKQFMGFPMLAVAVWLIGVLSAQLSIEGLQWALAAVLFLALALWILGRFGGFDRKASTRMKARVAAAVVFLLSIGVAWSASAQRAPASQIDLREVIADHRENGRPVFVDFTAEWCVTCKVNERATIKTEKVQNLFKDSGIEFLIADWTNEDPNITELLKGFGRAGVPFYVLYPGDPDAEPISLGDGIITVGDIEEAIAKLPQG